MSAPSRSAVGRLSRLIGLLAILLGWEAVGRLGIVSQLILATPSQILAAFIDEPRQLFSAFLVTTTTILVTAAITWIAGVGIGLWLGTGRLRSTAMSPILSSLFAIPLVIWYPLFVTWFGLGMSSKVAFGIFGGFFPIALSSIAGARMLEGRYIQYGRSIGASRSQMLIQVLMPLAFPTVAAGLRVGTALIVISVIFAEMVASTNGIGYWISYHRSLFNTGHVYAGIILSLVSVGVVDLVLRRIEAKFRPWQ